MAADLARQGMPLSRRQVRRWLGGWKRSERRRRERAAAARRVHVEVRARDALWTVDGTQLGRWERKKVVAEVVREVGSTRVLGESEGGPARSAEVAGLLKEVASRRGCWPAVVALDGGPENRGHEVREVLEQHGVVVLRNLPHTPQHNAWSERGMRELKEELETWSGAPCGPPWVEAERLAAASVHLNEVVPRPSRGGRTAVEQDAALPPWYTVADRDGFRAAACRAQEEACARHGTTRARRLAEPRALLEVMEVFGLIQRTQGEPPRSAVRGEMVS